MLINLIDNTKEKFVSKDTIETYYNLLQKKLSYSKPQRS